MTVPRPTWAPASYDEAVDDASNRRVFEHHYLELKREYAAGKNRDLAGDLAGLANDSGLLVVGVDEDPATRVSTGVVPFALKGFIERVEQVARALDPPLNVECTALADPANLAVGLVLIRVPASALAPHQAHKRYYGRNERSTYELADAEVETLMRRRGVRADRVSSALEQPPGFSWVRGSSVGRFAAVVEPAAGGNAELLADQLGSAGFIAWLDGMVAAAVELRKELVAADPSVGEFVWPDWSPFAPTGGWSNGRTGSGVVRRSSAVPNDSPYRTVWLGVDESGATNLAMDQMVFAEPNVMPKRTVFDWRSMVGATSWLVVLARAIHESVGLAAPLAVGVRAEGLSAAFPLEAGGSGTLERMLRRDQRSPFTADEYRGQGHVAYQPIATSGPALRAGLRSAFGRLLRVTGMEDPLRQS